MTTASYQSADGPQINYVTGDPKEWPPELDAMIAASDFHRVLLENDHVRVLEVYLPPNAVEPPHHHRWPSVVMLIEGGLLVDHNGMTGEVLLDTSEFGGLKPIDTTTWKEPEAMHYVKNLSDTDPIRLIRVELKTVTPSGSPQRES